MMNKETIRSLPKGEFHLHLEGALPYHLLKEREPVLYGDPPPSWAPDYRFRDFAHFDDVLLDAAGRWFKSVNDYHTAAREIFRIQREQNVRYAEVSIASGCLELNHLELSEVLQAVRSAAPEGLTLRIFLGVHHDGFTPWAAPVIKRALAEKDLDGFDLHGVETIPLEPWTARVWKEAREAGKFTKAHAGEFSGPSFVRHAVEVLGVNRIEHGIRAVEEPSVMELLRDRGVTLDICPVSNLKLGVVPSLKHHPLPALAHFGINCTVSRDDPFCFGSTLDEEYSLLQSETGLSDRDILALMAGGFKAALATEREKRVWLDELSAAAGGKIDG
jgi:adenosine deaminase